MMMIVEPEQADGILSALEKAGENAFVIGEIVKGQGVAIQLD